MHQFACIHLSPLTCTTWLANSGACMSPSVPYDTSSQRTCDREGGGDGMWDSLT